MHYSFSSVKHKTGRQNLFDNSKKKKQAQISLLYFKIIDPKA